MKYAALIVATAAIAGCGGSNQESIWKPYSEMPSNAMPYATAAEATAGSPVDGWHGDSVNSGLEYDFKMKDGREFHCDGRSILLGEPCERTA